MSQKELPDCAICLETKLTPNCFQCGTCKNSHCPKCHSQMRRCPFCRANFPDVQEPTTETLNTQPLSQWTEICNVKYIYSKRCIKAYPI